MLSKEVCFRCVERRKLYEKLYDEYAIGDTKVPDFDRAWNKNIVVCPCMSNIDLISISNCNKNCQTFLLPKHEIVEWKNYKLAISAPIPYNCSYSLEHVVDSVQEEDTFKVKIGKSVDGNLWIKQDRTRKNGL